jgi:acyl carrier protein
METAFVELLRGHLRYAGAEDIPPDAKLRDLGLNSMQAIELLFAVEDRYGVSIPDEHLVDATFETGGALWTVVERLRDGRLP